MTTDFILFDGIQLFDCPCLTDIFQVETVIGTKRSSFMHVTQLSFVLWLAISLFIFFISRKCYDIFHLYFFLSQLQYPPWFFENISEIQYFQVFPSVYRNICVAPWKVFLCKGSILWENMLELRHAELLGRTSTSLSCSASYLLLLLSCHLAQILPAVHTVEGEWVGVETNLLSCYLD